VEISKTPPVEIRDRLRYEGPGQKKGPSRPVRFGACLVRTVCPTTICRGHLLNNREGLAGKKMPHIVSYLGAELKLYTRPRISDVYCPVLPCLPCHAISLLNSFGLLVFWSFGLLSSSSSFSFLLFSSLLFSSISGCGVVGVVKKTERKKSKMKKEKKKRIFNEDWNWTNGTNGHCSSLYLIPSRLNLIT